MFGCYFIRYQPYMTANRQPLPHLRQAGGNFMPLIVFLLKIYFL
jgi:hypothetical protein